MSVEKSGVVSGLVFLKICEAFPVTAHRTDFFTDELAMRDLKGAPEVIAGIRLHEWEFGETE
ncbi:MAG: hypothetical protein AAYR33_02310 [Acetobacteraceae bacterium]